MVNKFEVGKWYRSYPPCRIGDSIYSGKWYKCIGEYSRGNGYRYVFFQGLPSSYSGMYVHSLLEEWVPRVGDKVKLPVGKRSSYYDWEDTSIYKLCKEQNQNFAYITRILQNMSEFNIVLGADLQGLTSEFKLWDLEPYNEEIKMEKTELQQIEELEAKIDELKKTVIEKETKAKKWWPDSYEEAVKISKYWGFITKSSGRKYRFTMEGALGDRYDSSYGRAFSYDFCTYTSTKKLTDTAWTDPSCTFYKFNSEKELSAWMNED